MVVVITVYYLIRATGHNFKYEMGRLVVFSLCGCVYWTWQMEAVTYRVLGYANRIHMPTQAITSPR